MPGRRCHHAPGALRMTGPVADDVTSAPRLSVCIVSGRRTDLLDACLASLQVQEDPPPFELLVAADADPEVHQVVLRRFPDAILREGVGHPGAARNVLLRDARGEWLVFLDDDVVVERNLLRRVADLADANPDVDVLGGPNLTPPHSSLFQVVQGAVLASIVAAGPVRRRYGFHPSGEVDERFFTLCNLSIRRTAMLPFPPELVCAEENSVLAELAHQGSVMQYDPHLAVYHERRGSYRGFAQQMHKYGRGRGQLIVRNWRTARLSHFIPSALVAYVLASPLLALVEPLLVVPLVAYAAAVAVSSAVIARSIRRQRLWSWALAGALTVTLHGCYGTGVVSGLLRRSRRRPRPQPGAPEVARSGTAAP